MGQYQLWLHYRNIDRLLHTQLEELEEELAQLQIREQLLQQILQPVTEDASSLLQSDNEILRALAIGLNAPTEPIEHSQGYTQSTNGTGGTDTLSGHPVRTLSGEQVITDNEVKLARPCLDPFIDTHSSQSNEPVAAISSAASAQNGLPPVDEQNVTKPDSLQPSIPHSPHYEPMLLPEDMDAFIDGHSETEPRMELPVWLRNAALHNTNGLMDQESIRTNRLIQRWIERWGHQRQQEEHPDAQERHEEDASL